MIGKAIYDRLMDDAAITAIVAARISPAPAEPTTAAYPLIVYEPGELETDMTYEGPSGLIRRAVTITAIATTHTAAADLADLIRASLDGQSGTWGGVVVQGAFFQGQRESTTQTDVGAESTLYLVELDFSVWHIG